MERNIYQLIQQFVVMPFDYDIYIRRLHAYLSELNPGVELEDLHGEPNYESYSIAFAARPSISEILILYKDNDTFLRIQCYSALSPEQSMYLMEMDNQRTVLREILMVWQDLKFRYISHEPIPTIAFEIPVLFEPLDAQNFIRAIIKASNAAFQIPAIIEKVRLGSSNIDSFP
jgi:hypothetical protein